MICGWLISDGVRIAAANSIEMLMENDFDLVLNDQVYHVSVPAQEKPSRVSQVYFAGYYVLFESPPVFISKQSISDNTISGMLKQIPVPCNLGQEEFINSF